MTPIGSRSNPTFKLLRLLSGSARERRRQGRSILDGPHLLGTYLDHAGRPILVAVSEAALDQPEIEQLLARAGQAPVYRLAHALFCQLAPVDTPVGILALIDIPRPLHAAGQGRFRVLLDGVQDPGNVGTIIRTAAAAGADTVLASPKCADAWSPRVLRAAMGAHFALGIHTGVDLLAATREFPGRTIATAGRDGSPPQDVDLTGSISVLFGAEGVGLDPMLLAAASARVSIPLAPGIESLNVGAAAAIVLFERVRQIAAIRP